MAAAAQTAPTTMRAFNAKVEKNKNLRVRMTIRLGIKFAAIVNRLARDPMNDELEETRAMYRNTILALVALGLLVFFAGPAAAEPEAEAEGEAGPTVEDFAKSLIGKDYKGSLEIEGWSDFGGGLVAPPIYVNHYQREDGKSLVLTSKETGGGSGFKVVDALVISKPWKGYVISIACMQGDDFTLRFVGDARGPESNEWWSEVRRAWEIAVPVAPNPDAEAQTETEPDAKAETEAEAAPAPDPGKITKAATRGVKCTNPNW